LEARGARCAAQLLERYDPLPINALAEGYKGKKTGKSTPIRRAKTTEKGLRPFGDRSVELHFSFCFQQNVMGGGGRGLKDTGRGLARKARLSPESRVIAVIARDRKGKTPPRINTDERGSGNVWDGSGMRSRNFFVFLIEAWGEGRDRRNRRHRA